MDQHLISSLQNLINERGLPRNVKTSIQDSLQFIQSKGPDEMKLATLVCMLDEASSDPNVSSFTRTKIWSIVSALECCKKV